MITAIYVFVWMIGISVLAVYLYSISGAFGYTREDIDALLEEGITPEEIEEYFYGMVPYEL